MHPDLLDILANQQLPIEDQQLIDYLTGRLNDDDSHEVERKLAASGWDEEALEGLEMVKDKEKLRQYHHEINTALGEKLKQRKSKTRRRKEPNLIWIMLVAAGLLALALVAWFIIQQLKTG